MTDTVEPEIEHPTADNAKPAHETWRIVFLDNEANVEALKGTCKEEGYVVIGATSIDEVWAFLNGKDHADVIVCAAFLEGESLFELLAGVRNSVIHRDTMVLVLSLEPSAQATILDRSTERAAIALGADAYLVMPELDPCALISELRKLTPRVPMLQRAMSDEERRRSE